MECALLGALLVHVTASYQIYWHFNLNTAANKIYRLLDIHEFTEEKFFMQRCALRYKWNLQLIPFLFRLITLLTDVTIVCSFALKSTFSTPFKIYSRNNRKKRCFSIYILHVEVLIICCVNKLLPTSKQTHWRQNYSKFIRNHRKVW